MYELNTQISKDSTVAIEMIYRPSVLDTFLTIH